MMRPQPTKGVSLTLAGVLMLAIAAVSLFLDVDAIPITFLTLGIVFTAVGSRQRRLSSRERR